MLKLKNKLKAFISLKKKIKKIKKPFKINKKIRQNLNKSKLHLIKKTTAKNLKNEAIKLSLLKVKKKSFLSSINTFKNINRIEAKNFNIKFYRSNFWGNIALIKNIKRVFLYKAFRRSILPKFFDKNKTEFFINTLTKLHKKIIKKPKIKVQGKNLTVKITFFKRYNRKKKFRKNRLSFSIFEKKGINNIKKSYENKPNQKTFKNRITNKLHDFSKILPLRSKPKGKHADKQNNKHFKNNIHKPKTQKRVQR